jgi:hypothetical protein
MFINCFHIKNVEIELEKSRENEKSTEKNQWIRFKSYSLTRVDR